MKGAKVIIFQTINRRFHSDPNIRVTWITVAMKRPSGNLVLIKKGTQVIVFLYFDKFEFTFFKFFNFSALFSAVVQILCSKQNGLFRLQWFGWLDVKHRHLCVPVGLWKRFIEISFLFLFIKISRNGIWCLLYSIVNCIEGLIDFKMSNNSSGLIFLLHKSVKHSSKKQLHFCLI